MVVVVVKETEHARQRRAERGIDKKDLEAALKYGKEQFCRFGRKVEYNGLCYVVKQIGRRKWEEVTCYASTLKLTKVPITPQIEVVYDSATRRLSDHGTWKSNTVIVVDTSGSMRNSDVWGARSRLHAVWLCLALDFIAHRLETGDAGPFDVISIVLLGNETKVFIEEEPTTWKLYNNIVDIYTKSCNGQARGDVVASGHGNYIPSLNKAEELLTLNKSSSCALALCWMSDGKPSDQGDARDLILPKVKSLAERFGRRLSFSAIALGDDSNEFQTLQSMVDTAKDFGVQASFVLPSMTTAGLGVSITATATSLTKTQTEMTDMATLKQRSVRQVLRESRTKASEEKVEVVSSDEYFLYPIDRVVRRIYNVWHDEQQKRRHSYDFAPMQNPSTCFVALNKKAFGEGAERYAFRFFEVDEHKKVVGKPLVAKESRLVLDGGEAGRAKFVRTFCETQQLARRIAAEFNEKLGRLRRVDDRTPRVSFLDCSVYELNDKSLGRQEILVEEKIDHLSWHKWNMNNGYVEGMEVAPEFTHDKMQSALEHLSMLEVTDERVGNDLLADLGAIEEGDEEDSDDESTPAGDHIQPIIFTASDVAQAFSHFSYMATGRKRLICDLQGVFDTQSNTLKFSDPVIHYFNYRRQERHCVHGRTDRGRKGMAMFFDTHKGCCGHLCRLVNGGFRRSRRPMRR